MLARDLGKINYFTESETREFAGDETKKWGFPRPAIKPGNEALRHARQTTCSAKHGRQTGVEPRAFEPPALSTAWKKIRPLPTRTAFDQEELVKKITRQVLAELQKKSAS